jgi:sRNA-binding protein
VTHQYVSEHFPTERSARAKIVLGILADKFPACFAIYERRRRPLKLGIHHDIIAALDGAIAPRDLSSALRCYVANAGYLRACTEDADRIDLAGNAKVTGAEAAGAAARLEHYKAKRQRAPARIEPTDSTSPVAKPRKGAVAPAPAVPVVGRLSLSDLKIAAAARRQKQTPTPKAGAQK